MKNAGNIFGLQYDYIQQDGNFIQITREHVLKNDELTLLQLKMLQFNQIPHLLPCECEEMNHEVRLLYRFTHRRMLSHEIRLKSLSLSDFYQLLYHIASIILENKAYLLDDAKYILHEDFIFVGQNYTDLYLCYLPIQSLTDKAEVHQDLHTLAMNLISYVDEMKGDGFQKLLQLFHDSHFSLEEFKILTYELLEQEKVKRYESPSVAKKEKPSKIQNESVYGIHDGNNNNEDSEKVSSGNDSKKDDHERNSGIKRLFGIRPVSYLMIAFLFLMVVGIYIQNSSEALFFICLGITILLIDALYIIIKCLKPVSQMEAEVMTPPSPIPASEYYEQLPNHTTLLHHENETVFLQQDFIDPVQNTSATHKAYLEIHSDEGSKRIHLTEEPLIIGRDPEVSHYVVHSIGASRTHCEISLLNHEHIIKDLASSNGTYLNDEAIVPYKNYVLKQGDRIRIVQSDFVFHIDDS